MCKTPYRDVLNTSLFAVAMLGCGHIDLVAGAFPMPGPHTRGGILAAWAIGTFVVLLAVALLPF